MKFLIYFFIIIIYYFIENDINNKSGGLKKMPRILSAGITELNIYKFKTYRKIKDETNFAYSEQQRLDMMLEMTYENEKVLIFGIEQGYTYEKRKTSEV